MDTIGKLLLIYTGGTIGMVQDPETGGLIPFNFDTLLEHIPEIKRLSCSFDVHSFIDTIDSSDITPEDWIHIAEVVRDNYNDYTGFVILHGSDTMAYTASALSFLLGNLEKPVILTGSQLPAGVPRTDASENLITAMEIAMATHKNGMAKVPEVAIYFEYKLYRGNRAVKTDAENFKAYDSGNYPCLAKAGVNILFNKEAILPINGKPLKVYTQLNSKISVLKMFPGISERNLLALLSDSEMEGLVIESFGAGNIGAKPWFYKLLAGKIKEGLLVVNVSQCLGGSVNHNLYKSAEGLLKIGVLSGYDLTSEAAITKLMFVLANETDPERRKAYMIQDLRGEMTTC